MKSIKTSRWLFPFAAFILVSCATPKTTPPEVSSDQVESEAHKQRVMVLKSYVAQQMRLYDVSYKVLKGSADLCNKTRDIAGYKVVTKSSFSDKYRDAAIELYTLGEWPKVVHVVPDSPALRAGLQVGDEIQEAKEGTAPTDSQGAGETNPSPHQAERVLKLGVLRNGERLDIELEAVQCCDCDMAVVPIDEVNAFTDGNKIYVTRGMMRFLDSELELATVVSHELAHKIRGHMEDEKTNITAGVAAGLVLDIAAAIFGINTGGSFSKLGAQAGHTAFSKDREREADYVGMYILARSGYAYEDAPNIFRKLAYTEPGMIETKYAGSHPSTAERFVALEKAAEEIKGKTAMGLPLTPQEKGAPSPPVQAHGEDKASSKAEAKKPEQEQVAAISGDKRPEVSEKIKLREKGEPDFSDQDLQKLIKERNFYNRQYNPTGDFPNAFVDNGDGTITDEVTGLMWQKAGSPSEMTFDATGRYVQELNSRRFGGYGDWRLPTTDELCSLLERNPNKNGEFVESLFDPVQEICWSADENQHYIQASYRIAFCVNFSRGEILAGWAEKYAPHHTMSYVQTRYYVRAVRTAE